MGDSSDNVLLTISVVVVVISAVVFFGILSLSNNGIRLAPGSTSNESLAFVNITISQNLAINFINDTIDWGRGSVNSGLTFSNLTTEGLFDGWDNLTAANVTHGFVLENTGNINASLYIRTDKNATEFIMDLDELPGGPYALDPLFRETFAYKINECGTGTTDCSAGDDNRQNLGDDAASCGDNLTALDVYYHVNATTALNELGTLICNQYGHLDLADEIRIDLNIVIPGEAPLVAKYSIITATAELAPVV